MRKSYVIAAIILLSAAAWIGSGLVFKGEEENSAVDASGANGTENATGDPEKQSFTRVRVAESVAQERTDELRTAGRTAADRILTVRAETSSLVAEVLVDKGDKVVAGDVLVRLAMNDREARLARARAMLDQRQLQYDAAKELQAQNYASRVRLAEARAALEEARAIWRKSSSI